VGSDGFLSGLSLGGFTRDALFGGGGPESLSSLAQGSIFATLIPDDSAFFALDVDDPLVAGFASAQFLGIGETLYLSRDPSLASVGTIKNGDFQTGGLDDWDVTGPGTVEPVDTGGGNTAAKLTTGSPVTLGQLIDTADSPFEISFDYLFETVTGELDIVLNSIVLDTLLAPSTLYSDFKQHTLQIFDPSLFGLAAVPLEFMFDGPSNSVVLLDNVVAESVPEPEPGDFDDDGDTDGNDLLTWQRGESPNSLSTEDLAAWEANYGMVATHSAASAAVPEPTTSALALAALCLATRRRRIAAR